jgi:hypothetical protein
MVIAFSNSELASFRAVRTRREVGRVGGKGMIRKERLRMAGGWELRAVVRRRNRSSEEQST